MQLQHANLPETAQQIADVIGYEKTMELVRAKQGDKCRSLYVPTSGRLKDSHLLVQTLGVEAARELANEFAGYTLSLPRCPSVFKQERNKKVIQMRQQGMKYQSIAEELDMELEAVKAIYYRWAKMNN